MILFLPFLGFKISRAVSIMRREASWRFCRFRYAPPSEGFLNLYLRFAPLPEKTIKRQNLDSLSLVVFLMVTLMVKNKKKNEKL